MWSSWYEVEEQKKKTNEEKNTRGAGAEMILVNKSFCLWIYFYDFFGIILRVSPISILNFTLIINSREQYLIPANLCRKCCSINVYDIGDGFWVPSFFFPFFCWCIYSFTFHFRIISFIIGKGESKLVSVDILVEFQLQHSILRCSLPTFFPFYYSAVFLRPKFSPSSLSVQWLSFATVVSSFHPPTPMVSSSIDKVFGISAFC